MAKKKTPPAADTAEARIEDAVIIDETAKPTEAGVTAEDSAETTADPVSDDKAAEGETTEDAASAESSQPEHEAAPVPLSEPEDAPAAEAAEDAREVPRADPPQPAPVVVRKGGFFPMLLGGAAAAVIGFGAARYVLPEGWPFPATSGASEAVAAVEARVGETAAGLAAATADIATLRERLDEVAQPDAGLSDLGARLDSLTQTLAALETRIAALEARPAPDGAALSPDVTAEIAALREALSAQAAEISAMTDAAAAEEEAAALSASAALARAALNRVQAALDSGTDYRAALADLADTGVEVPQALIDGAEGVPTLADLQSSYTETARAALAAARRGGGEEGGTLGGFLRSQLGVRSLEPREGDDPDAVLSRAEAALRDGRVADTLAELAVLPEAARVALADWSGRAAARLSAVEAAETLAQTLIAD